SFGFHKPLYIQFTDFISNVLKGDLGISVLFYPTRVTTLIATYLPWTIALVTPAVAFAWFVGNSIGVMAAMNRNKFIDKVLLTMLVVFQGTPSYIFGMYLIMLLAVYLPIFPTGGSYPPGMVPRLSLDFVLAYLRHYVLPFIAIFLTSLGGWGLSMRSIAIQELSSDYMEYLRVIGVSQGRVSRYLFKCSALPQIVGLAIVLGWSVAGSVITEIVFSYQGIGLILWRGVQSLDYPLIQGIFIIIIGTLLLANYISELLFAYIDPRIRYAYVGR
ncbi:MAG: ABC transporter permease, partial [Ignisphaera sp.]|nr:ABC transporter permease [Ignisphaera sp.]